MSLHAAPCRRRQRGGLPPRQSCSPSSRLYQPSAAAAPWPTSCWLPSKGGLNGASAWLLRQRQQPVVWAAEALQEPPLRATVIAMAGMACGLMESHTHRDPHPASPQELVLAAEATGLTVAALQAELDRCSAAALRDPVAVDASGAIVMSLMRMKFLCMSLVKFRASTGELDLSSVPSAVESLVGAAEACLRLSAAVVQQLQLSEGVGTGGGVSSAQTSKRPSAPAMRTGLQPLQPWHTGQMCS